MDKVEVCNQIAEQPTLRQMGHQNFVGLWHFKEDEQDEHPKSPKYAKTISTHRRHDDLELLISRRIIESFIQRALEGIWCNFRRRSCSNLPTHDW